MSSRFRYRQKRRDRKTGALRSYALHRKPAFRTAETATEAEGAGFVERPRRGFSWNLP